MIWVIQCLFTKRGKIKTCSIMGNECVWLQWLQEVGGESSSCQAEHSFFSSMLFDISCSEEYINLFLLMQLGFNSSKQGMLNKSALPHVCAWGVYYSFGLWWKLLIVTALSAQFCLHSLTSLLCVLKKWLITKDRQNIRPSILPWKLQSFTFLFQG